MNLEDVKTAVSTHYPQPVRWQPARKIRTGTGKRRRHLRRQIGISSDNYLSMEAVGPKTDLRYVEFMLPMHNAEPAAVNAAFTIQFIRAVDDPEFSEGWLIDRVKEQSEGETGQVKVSWQPTELKGESIPIMFVRVMA